MEQQTKTPTAPRRKHLPEFKARVVNQCAQPGASVAAVAQSHGLHANLVHRWCRLARQADHGTPKVGTATAHPLTPPPCTDIGRPRAVAAITTAAKVVSAASHPATLGDTSGAFIALAHPTTQTCDTRRDPAGVAQADSIHIDILRTHAHIHVRWPTSAASDCALWLKDLLHDPPRDPHQDPRAGVRRGGTSK